MRYQLVLFSMLAALAVGRAIPWKRADDYCHNTQECNVYYNVGDPASGVDKMNCAKDIFGNNGKCKVKKCTDNFPWDDEKEACVSIIGGYVNGCPTGMFADEAGGCTCYGSQVKAEDEQSCFTP